MFLSYLRAIIPYFPEIRDRAKLELFLPVLGFLLIVACLLFGSKNRQNPSDCFVPITPPTYCLYLFDLVIVLSAFYFNSMSYHNKVTGCVCVCTKGSC